MTISGYLTGTRILTTGGGVPVETLVEGELVVTRAGRVLPVMWVARSRFDPRHHAVSGVAPIRVRRDALEEGIPHRDILLAPDQCLIVDGFAASASRLVNGASIVRERITEPIAYFSVGLEGEDVLMAEGAAVLSGGDPAVPPRFVDAPARFRRARDGWCAHPGASSEPAASLAPVGPDMLAAHARLAARAAAVGFTQTTDPAPRAVVRGEVLYPTDRTDRLYQFHVPPGSEEIRLVSRSFVPDEMQLTAGDDRRLGVALAAIRLHSGMFRLSVALDDPAHTGLHVMQSEGSACWRWTDGDARLRCPALPFPATLTIELAHGGTYWLPPRSSASADPADAVATASRRGLVLVSGEPDTPGHAYRIENLREAAEALGLAARVLRLDELTHHLHAIGDAHALVIWRAPYTAAVAEAITIARGRQIPVLFDLDDLMADPRLAREDVIDAIRFENHDIGRVRATYASIHDTLNAADATCCTTEELAVHLRWKDRIVHVLPNGFGAAILAASRLAVRRRRQAGPDGLIRIGYAGGTRTHQRDFARAAAALHRVLQDRPDCRLVLFRHPVWGPMVELEEFPDLHDCAGQIEWRDVVPPQDLPHELARFDINLAPLEAGNMFCEAKSELKFFEAALVEVCTIASPTGPFQRAIRHGETGFLADSADDWHTHLMRLIEDQDLRRRVAAAAFHDVLWQFGPERRAELLASILAQSRPGREAARAFALSMHRAASPRPGLPRLPEHEIIHAADRLEQADVTVIIPLYNYARFIQEALESARAQTIAVLDLVVVDDCSTDTSLEVVLDWVRRRGERFNRVQVLRNRRNAGLGPTRNVGFAAAETPFVLPLDADNRLLPHCVAACLGAIRETGASFVYPQIRQFGDATNLLSGASFSAQRLAGGNYIDAMALVAKPAWAGSGGYADARHGWEDYDFWCRLVEHGHWGQSVPEELAEYRVHDGSMLHTVTERRDHKQAVVNHLQDSHAWLTVRQVLETEARVAGLDPPAPVPPQAEPASLASRAARRAAKSASA